MSHHRFPLTWRLKSAVRDWLNNMADRARRPILRPQILLVTGDAGPNKVAEVESRLRYVCSHVDAEIDFKTVHSVTPKQVLAAVGVAIVDADAVPSIPYRRLRWVVDLDYDTDPLDAWKLAQLGSAISHQPTPAHLSESRQRFVERVAELRAGGDRPAYIFGTGPSLSRALQRSFRDGTTIVCNTIVRDRELWQHLSPRFLAAGDAIYHFGHTEHARAFRADALLRLKESNGETLFVYPAVYDYVVRDEFEAVESQLVPIPRGLHTDAAVDLTKEFSIPALGNVLGDLLLPLGCTVSHDVRLWGFDGRSPSDTGFWANSDRQSYPEFMSALREAHPAFFSHNVPQGNEIRYVKEVHGELLDARLNEAEGQGFTFSMLHQSWTPILQKRYRESDLDLR